MTTQKPNQILVWIFGAALRGPFRLLVIAGRGLRGKAPGWYDYPVLASAVALAVAYADADRQSTDIASAFIFVALAGVFSEWIAGKAQPDKVVARGSAVSEAAAIVREQRKAYGGEEALKLNLKVGGISILANHEAEHILVTGKTGAGKTQIINGMLEQVRLRNQTAIIADPSGGYFSRFGQDGDYLFNPFDGRCVEWSPFAEIKNSHDCARIARAIVPDGHGGGAEWRKYAQTLLSALLKHQWEAGDYSIRELTRLLAAAPPAELHLRIGETAAGAFTGESNEKMLGSIRSTITPFISAFEYLADQGRWSVRDFVQAAAARTDGGWLFITYRDDQMAQLRELVPALIDMAVVEALSLDEDPDRRLFFVLDELDSLGQVSSLDAALTKLRKYGGVVISGVQTIAQLRATYGRDQAQTLLSCMSTKAILTAGDGETAEYLSSEIGDQEFTRTNTSKSDQRGDLTAGSTSTSTEHRTERAVLPSEITGLENLSGYLRTPGLNGVIKFHHQFRNFDQQETAFVAQKN